MTADSVTTDQLLSAASLGNSEALAQVLARHREYVRQLVAVRLEPALRARVDASDIVQETMVVASQRLDEYLAQRSTSFRVWLRRNALERLADARRRHLAKKRDARRDFSITDASSLAIARYFAEGSARHAAMRRELAQRVHEVLSGLAEADQEIILLRHAEGLTNAEVAEVLEIDPGTASKQYGRAIGRLSRELRRLGLKSD